MILAIDAVYTLENLERSNWSGYQDPDKAPASANRLAELAAREKALVITGHDPRQ